MEEITYKQAAELLSCEYITIRQAVMQKRLTKCVGKTTLLKEQVQLFKDKRGITIHALNIKEKELWEEYKKIAESPDLLKLAKEVPNTKGDLWEEIVGKKLTVAKASNNEKDINIIVVTCIEELEGTLKLLGINPIQPLVLTALS
jgi:hypothetical protein